MRKKPMPPSRKRRSAPPPNVSNKLTDLVPADFPDLTQHTLHPPQDGIEILVHMAKTGQLDPWNIDIVQVADQYLQAVSELKASDLRITGKTLLFLAILLRMKSDQLAGIHYLDPPQEVDF